MRISVKNTNPYCLGISACRFLHQSTSDGITIHFENKGTYYVASIALPDVDMDTLEVLLGNEHLTVHALLRHTTPADHLLPVRHIVRLPDEIDREHSWAEYKKGSMKVIMPMARHDAQ